LERRHPTIFCDHDVHLPAMSSTFTRSVQQLEVYKPGPGQIDLFRHFFLDADGRIGMKAFRAFE
jgi:hypothetical protein